MVVYSIKGDYTDCQLYSGNLFLWTYSGELRIYNFARLISALIEKREISEQSLQYFLVGTVDRMSARFPTDSEVYGGKYYLTFRDGLYQSQIYELEQGFKKVWDCPLLSISAQRKKGLTMAGGVEGTYIYSEVDAIRERYGMKEKTIVQASSQHANYSAFCSQGLYATSILQKSYYVMLSALGFDKPMVTVDEIFPNQIVTLSWSYRNKVYAYIDDKIYVKTIEKGKDGIEFKPLKQYRFYPQKGRVLSGTSTDFADIIELEHALVILPTCRTVHTHAETIWTPVTRWRTFPKSYGYNNVILVILEDELRIFVVDGEDGPFRPVAFPDKRKLRKKIGDV